MMRMVSNTKRRPQEKKGVNSMWALAHDRWVTQLLVRLSLEPNLSDFLNKDRTVPA